jgi:hypothetical protein
MAQAQTCTRTYGENGNFKTEIAGSSIVEKLIYIISISSS